MSHRGLSTIVALFGLVILSAGFARADLVAGDLAIYRIGDGSMANLTSASTAVFIDEYTTSGTFVQSFAAPTAASGGNNPLTASGTATSEGELNLSSDGTRLVVTGYAAAPGTAGIAGTSTGGGSPVLRDVGLVAPNGSFDTSTTTTSFSANNIRSATYDAAIPAIWMTGANTGVVKTTVGGSGAGTVVSNTITNNRNVNVSNGQLYTSDSSGSAVRLGKVGSGEPTGTGNTITNLTGFATAGSPYQFVFARLGGGTADNGFDTLYVADDTASTGGIQKWSFNGTNWSLLNTVTGSGIRGLTGQLNGATFSLYATGDVPVTNGIGTSKLYSLLDTAGFGNNLNGTLTALVSKTYTTGTAIASASNDNIVFRGIAFVPVPEASAVLFGGLVCGVFGVMYGVRSLRRKAAAA